MSLLDSFPHKCRIQRRRRINDELAGSREVRITEQTDVECWEQQVSSSAVLKYAKMGMNISTKIYFLEDPGVTDRHEIVITERNGTSVPTAQQVTVQSLTPAIPDASAGLGVLFRVMGSDTPGQGT